MFVVNKDNRLWFQFFSKPFPHEDSPLLFFYYIKKRLDFQSFPTIQRALRRTFPYIRLYHIQRFPFLQGVLLTAQGVMQVCL